MKNMFKIISVSIGLVFCSGLTALAGPYEDAEAAYKSGDRETALKFARKGVAAKDAKSQHMLGFMYEHGQGGIEASIPMAMFWYQKSGNQGHAPAQHDLGYLYETGYEDILKPSDVDAAFWYAKAAVQGHANAQFSLGKMYEWGRAVTQSMESALYWYEKAAAQGQVGAKSRVPILLARLSVPQSAPVRPQINTPKNASIKTTRLSVAELRALHEQAKAFYKRKEYVEARKAWRKAGDGGLPASWSLVGLMYSKGEGVPQDETQAVYWYRKAAVSGVASAQLQLGTAYHNGEGIGKSYAQAIVWYTKSAEQGNGNAQFALSKCYINGHGVEVSETQALYWLKKSARRGNAIAISLLKKNGIPL